MAVLVFLIILSGLVVVHELGHFLFARAAGIRVDEFGLGYPPKARKLFTWRGTDFTLNWLPFGGFVKIFGESYEEGRSPGRDNFQAKRRGTQVAVLAAGSLFNLLSAWLLLSLGFMGGLPAAVGRDMAAAHPETVVSTVVSSSPAEQAGLKPGDTLLKLQRGASVLEGGNLSPETVSSFIGASREPLTVTFSRGGRVSDARLAPADGLVPGRPAVGIATSLVGTVRLPPGKALVEGARLSWSFILETFTGIKVFIARALTFRADLSSVTGPVGLVSLTGDAESLGLGYLVIFVALISINLGLINLLPFPALDGGRIVFVAVEALTGKKIPPRVFNAVNTAGFALLILLMILVTIHDVRTIL